ncbi:hypothetical protein C8F04DRAFT_624893 [Mycena alexandri]|uniref:F-box domain-containing protein n=1 Tax=Mycena alexandri TaxID=1745969 RepID=A0AAD6X3F5_9AGAR|nr:hypothetical protein C8F04DRAFT_624893 [Mycena alexandri]
MGTSGVYRHNGYYHAHYNAYDSYPEELGVRVAAEIPLGDEQAYQEWLRNLRKALDYHLEMNQHRVGSQEFGDDHNGYLISEEPTPTEVYKYEIDLDHEVFLVDDEPLFALNIMPNTPDLFVECIGYDSFGHPSYTPSTPVQHIYNWKSAPPKVEDQIISDYTARRSPKVEYLPISRLLGTSESVGDCEAARIGLYEVIIGNMMLNHSIAHDIRILETICDQNHISDDMLTLGIEMVQLGVGKMLFGQSVRRPCVPELKFSWLAPDICLSITTHLDDERNLKKSILQLVDKTSVKRPSAFVIYGILFSFFQCVVIRIDPNHGFQSTAPLQFLPSFHATSPSTPGITAIGRLGYHCLDTPKAGPRIQPHHYLCQVPVELLDLITTLLSPSDLDHLCTAVPPFEAVAGDRLRYPYIDDYRLVQRIRLSSTDLRDTRDHDKRRYVLTSITTKRFSAVLPGSSEKKVLVVCNRGTGTFGVSSVQ